MTIQDIYMMYVWEDNAKLPNLLPKTVMEYGTPQLFDFDYDVPVDKATFEDGFNKRFYLKEIGFETVDIFKQKLDYTININSEKYKMLYKDLLSSWQMRNQNQTTVNEQTSNQGNVNDTGNETTNQTQNVIGSSNASGNDRITGNNNQNTNTRNESNSRDTIAVNNSQIYSDTPDNRLNNLTINPNNDRFSLNYASSLTDNLTRQNQNTGVTVVDNSVQAVTSTQDQRTQANTSTNQTANGNTTKQMGNQRTTNQSGTVNQTTTFMYSSDITTYRNFLEVYQPILKMILDDLEPLFMGVF